MKGKRHSFGVIRHRYRSIKRWRALAVLSPVCAMAAMEASAQDESAAALAQRSAIVVAGKVVRVNASLEPMQAAASNTIVITISRMYAGAEIAGDQKGRMATVLLSHPSPAVKPGAEALFFGNPRFIGNSLTIADEGELFAGAASAANVGLEATVQTRRDQPLVERMASASSIFLGKVESEHPITVADQAGERREPASEHDPEWRVASVRVLTSLRGATEGALVNVIFPASRDVMWFNAPKLKEGQESIFITHAPERSDERLMRAPGVAAFLERQPAEVVNQPFDVAPASDQARVRALLAKAR
jgi:hypothetical protein